MRKPPAPQRLTRGTVRTAKDCQAYAAHRADYEVAARRFLFDRNIYGHRTVKDALENAQNGKCCFCEGQPKAYAAADVEHYRPKGAVRQDQGSPSLKPGYFWLAYTWGNLYWCCQACNRGHKRDFFPLKDPCKRARSHSDDLTKEEPLILDPGGAEDPREHIRFHREIAVGLTEIGKTTIRSIGLNRVDLEETRRKRMAHLDALSRTVAISKRILDPELAASADDASRELSAAVLPDAEFSAMATQFVEQCA